MGNTPTKEAYPRISSFSNIGSGQAGSTRIRNTQINTTSSSSEFSDKISGKTDEKLRAREKHALDLVVRFRENVDGGFLAPFGTYKSNLDFDTQVVRDLILGRRLAPFYTPLQDFDESWTEDEIFALVMQSPLHALDSAYVDEEEVNDMDDHKIHRSQNYHKRQEYKKRLVKISAQVKEEQCRCEIEFISARTAVPITDPNIASRDLILKLYHNPTECPICFLYFPSPLNYSRCCQQPICTECFVQIKRLEPHPPHDEPNQQKEEELPQTLVSEPAHCPYCAMCDFGVTYDPPRDVHVGLGAKIKPNAYSKVSDYKSHVEEKDYPLEIYNHSTQFLKSGQSLDRHKPSRKSSIAAESHTVVTIDAIRPGWEQNLISAKSRLARKSAAATAIHASNLIMNNEGPSAQGRSDPSPTIFMSVEDRMVQEAMMLSLLDEEERLAKVRKEREGAASNKY